MLRVVTDYPRDHFSRLLTEMPTNHQSICQVSPCSKFEIEREELDLVCVEGLRGVPPRLDASVIGHSAADIISSLFNTNEVINDQR